MLNLSSEASTAALVGCAAVLLWHLWAGMFACNSDTASCAASQAKDTIYAGTLSDQQGRALPNTPFTVSFESRAGRSDVGGFSSDRTGDYCIRWAQEQISPKIHIAGQMRATEARASTALDGAAPPPGCEAGDAGIPWKRSLQLRDSTQFTGVFLLGFAAIGMLWAGLYYRTAPIRSAGALTALATLLLTSARWLL